MNHSRLFETTAAIATLPEAGYVRLPEVLRVIPVSKSTWWLGISKGRFPKGVKLSERITAWHVDDIRRCIAEFQHRQSR